MSATSLSGQNMLMIELILRDLVASDPDWQIGVLRKFAPVGAQGTS